MNFPVLLHSLLATALISLLPFLLLFTLLQLRPRKDQLISPFILRLAVAFAVGGLLGDALLHLIPHALDPHKHEFTKIFNPKIPNFGELLLESFYERWSETVDEWIDSIKNTGIVGIYAHEHHHDHDQDHNHNHEHVQTHYRGHSHYHSDDPKIDEHYPLYPSDLPHALSHQHEPLRRRPPLQSDGSSEDSKKQSLSEIAKSAIEQAESVLARVSESLIAGEHAHFEDPVGDMIRTQNHVHHLEHEHVHTHDQGHHHGYDLNRKIHSVTDSIKQSYSIGDEFENDHQHSRSCRNLHHLPHAHDHHSEPHAREHHAQAHDHSHSTKVGLLVLFGMLVFYVIEKMARMRTMHEHSHHGHSHLHSKKVGKSPIKVDQSETDDQEFVEEKKLRLRRQSKKTPAKHFRSDSIEPPRTEFVPIHELEKETKQLTALLNLLADCSHNFTDGLALFGSFSAGAHIGYSTTLAVLIHEIPHEIGDFAILLQSGVGIRQAMFFQLLTAIGAFAGVLFGAFSNGYSSFIGLDDDSISACILPFTAGTFIYVALCNVMPQLMNEKTTVRQLIAECASLISGVGLMAAIAAFE